ncbi:uncharacterized protein LOC127715794 [Mytilus californianus]|uniref:uncharacterized protein LOC127715794 n=1 Tax=Mytilus californianus TaxID=6549 RepID=UPI0022455832|nr:uncharacterized protein LOC127715794 [Mytilus californianus]
MNEAFISSEAPSTDTCHECQKKSQLFKCIDCTPWEMVCEDCLGRRHQYPHLHMFEAWRNEAFVGALLKTPSWILSSHSDCDTNYFKNIVIIDVKVPSTSRAQTALPLKEEQKYPHDIEIDHSDDIEETLPPGQLQEDITYKRLNKTIERIESRLKVKYTKTDILFTSHLSSAKEKNRLFILTKLQRSTSERHFLLDLIKKYARGQAIAIRLSKQVQKVVAKIKQALAEYNLVGEPSTSFPLKLNFDDIKNQDNEIWQKLEVTDRADSLSAVKRQAIQLKSMIDRAKEEQCLVKQEMVSTIKWYKHQHSLLIASMNNATKGRKACLVKEGLFIEAKLLEFIKSFDEHIVEESVQTIFFSIVGLDKDVVEGNDFDLPDFDENVLINVDFVDDDDDDDDDNDEDDINVLNFNEENLNYEDFEDDNDEDLHDI